VTVCADPADTTGAVFDGVVGGSSAITALHERCNVGRGYEARA
jgi:hypothetical protein